MQGLQFGEQVAGYDVRVLNEREIRAAAGILFLLALIAFMHAWLLGNFQWTRLFIVGFVLDFTIRLLLNPRYAPSMVLGRFMVRQQQPEYADDGHRRQHAVFPDNRHGRVRIFPHRGADDPGPGCASIHGAGRGRSQHRVLRRRRFRRK